jgi:glycosyltransferase involved in cell wall biosynthesis
MKLLIITQKINKADPILGFFHGWIREFSKHFDSIVGICLEKGEYDLPSNVRVLSLGKEGGQSKVKYLLNFYKFIWRERENYDAVFVHMNPVYVVLGGLLWKIIGKPIYLWYTHKSVDLKLRLAEIFAKKVFSASRESFRLSSDKLEIFGHGIDTDLFSPLQSPSTKSNRILSVGRISKSKNQLLMVEAVNKLIDRYSDIVLTIVGDSITKEDLEYKKQIEEKVKELGLKDHVFFVGAISPKDVVRYYQDTDLFINLSSTGSMDKAVLEAMSCGNKILTSNEAFRSIVPNENHTDNNVENISNGIRRLLDAPVDSRLREYVVVNHQLRALIRNLSGAIRK